MIRPIPNRLDEKKLKDKKILAMMRKVRLKVDREIEQKGWDRAARVTVSLANKQRPSKLIIHFKGTPRNPLSQLEVEDKARKLTRAILSDAAARAFGRGGQRLWKRSMMSRRIGAFAAEAHDENRRDR